MNLNHIQAKSKLMTITLFTTLLLVKVGTLLIFTKWVFLT